MTPVHALSREIQFLANSNAMSTKAKLLLYCRDTHIYDCSYNEGPSGKADVF